MIYPNITNVVWFGTPKLLVHYPSEARFGRPTTASRALSPCSSMASLVRWTMATWTRCCVSALIEMCWEDWNGACLCMFDIHIYIYKYPYHEELAGLCSTMGCWHVSTDFCAKPCESHRWAGIVDVSQLIHHFISNYLEGIWSHHNITIISRIGYLGTRYTNQLVNGT